MIIFKEVPRHDIDALETARKELIEALPEHLRILLINVTGIMWKITYRKYKELIKEDDE